MRVQQWYKNLVIFLALFYTNNLFNQDLLFKTLLGFISLCFVSSSYYIINDILDRNEDRTHREKSKRPIASGSVGIGAGLLVSIILLAASVTIAYSLSPDFLLFPMALFASSMLYNIWLRNVAIVDIHVIALNFLLRAVSGAVLINVVTSPWLITTVFFMALLLAIGKRSADLSALDKKTVNSRVVYKTYSKGLLDMMTIVIAAVLLFTYCLYTFVVHEKPYPYMMLTIPFVSFVIFRYLYFIASGHEIARKTHKIFLDSQMVVAILLWALTSLFVLYVLIPRSVLSAIN